MWFSMKIPLWIFVKHMKKEGLRINTKATKYIYPQKAHFKPKPFLMVLRHPLGGVMLGGGGWGTGK